MIGYYEFFFISSLLGVFCLETDQRIDEGCDFKNKKAFMEVTASEKNFNFSDHNAKINAKTDQDKVVAKIMAV